MRYPVVIPADGMKVIEGRWKKVRQFNDDTGLPGLSRMTLQLSLPADFTPGETSLDIEMGDRQFTLPVMVPPAIGRGPEIPKDEGSSKTFDPLKRTMLQENPEDEAPSALEPTRQPLHRVDEPGSRSAEHGIAVDNHHLRVLNRRQ